MLVRQCLEFKWYYIFFFSFFFLTFLVILLTSLYECETKGSMHICKVHPAKKQLMLQNEITEYAADMNMILAYYHLKDDWQDEKKVGGFLGTCALRHKMKKIIRKYPRQCRAIQKELHNLSRYEKKGAMEIDKPSGCFGRLMAELFVYKKDGWSSTSLLLQRSLSWRKLVPTQDKEVQGERWRWSSYP